MQIPNTPIIVDSFQFIPGVFVYLLTHLHSDHTGGLTPSWNNGTIYCSHVTRAILLEKFGLNPTIVIGLDEDCVNNIPLDTIKKVTMQVTLIDANHCPGACMFLLEGYFGTILHTGDFRFDPLILQHDAIRGKKIDHLYMDDTFCAPEYEFPTRAEAGKEVLDIISKYPDEYQILVGVDTLGKEELLVAIALKFQTLVVVDEERLRMINAMRKVIDLPDVFTHDIKQGRVVVLPKKQVNYRTVMQCRLTRPTVGIQPSGWAVNALKKEKDYSRTAVHRVAYSLHSSYSELEHFVKVIKPKALYSVSKHDNITLREKFGKYCSTEKVLPVIVPKSVQISMESKHQSLAVMGGMKKKKPLIQRKPLSQQRQQKGVQLKARKPEVVDLTDNENTPEENTFVIEDSDEEVEDLLANLMDDEVPAASASAAQKPSPNSIARLITKNDNQNGTTKGAPPAPQEDDLGGISPTDNIDPTAFLLLMDQLTQMNPTPRTPTRRASTSSSPATPTRPNGTSVGESSTNEDFGQIFTYPHKKRIEIMHTFSQVQPSQSVDLTLSLGHHQSQQQPCPTTPAKQDSLELSFLNDDAVVEVKQFTPSPKPKRVSLGKRKSPALPLEEIKEATPEEKKRRLSAPLKQIEIEEVEEEQPSKSNSRSSKSATTTPSKMEVFSTQALLDMPLSFGAENLELSFVNEDVPTEKLPGDEVEVDPSPPTPAKSLYFEEEEEEEVLPAPAKKKQFATPNKVQQQQQLAPASSASQDLLVDMIQELVGPEPSLHAISTSFSANEMEIIVID